MGADDAMSNAISAEQEERQEREAANFLEGLALALESGREPRLSEEAIIELRTAVRALVRSPKDARRISDLTDEVRAQKEMRERLERWAATAQGPNDQAVQLKRVADVGERIAAALERIAPAPPLISDGKSYPGQPTIFEAYLERIVNALEHQNEVAFHTTR